MECVACGFDLAGDEAECPECGLSYVTADLAGGWRRTAALLVDLLIAVLALGPAAGADYLIGLPLLTVYMGGGYAVWCLWLMRRGQTPGLNLLGLKVVDERGVTIGLPRYLLHRMVVGTLLPGFATFGVYLVLDVLWPFWDRNRQALHDKVAGTFVVEAAKAVSESEARGPEGPDGPENGGVEGSKLSASGTGQQGASGRTAWTG